MADYFQEYLKKKVKIDMDKTLKDCKSNKKAREQMEELMRTEVSSFR